VKGGRTFLSRHTSDLAKKRPLVVKDYGCVGSYLIFFLDNSRASFQLCPEGAEEHNVYLIDDDQETSEAEMPLYNGLSS